MTSRMIDFSAAMITAAAITFLAIGLGLTTRELSTINTRISIANESLSKQVAVLTFQVRDLQDRIAKLEGKQVIGE